jgi:hypothetical protein
MDIDRKPQSMSNLLNICKPRDYGNFESIQCRFSKVVQDVSLQKPSIAVNNTITGILLRADSSRIS